jgi:F-type H+-transporting ATPase subunit a
LEKTFKWRWGINRWMILGCVIFSIWAAGFAAPVQPHIQVAAEKLSETPLFTIPGLGDVFLTNTLTATIVIDLVLLAIALMVRSATRSGNLVPTGVAGAIEALIEIGYNQVESTAGKHAKRIFPWFMTIALVVLVANLVKLIPGFETIGLLHHYADGHPVRELGLGLTTVLPGTAPEGEGFIVTPFLRALSTDLNFTAALALIAVLWTQVIGVQTQGLRYFTKFFNYTTLFKKPFFGFMDFAVGLLETISEFSKILSFAFRLFGNMFAGMVLLAVVGTLMPVFVPSLVMMFEFFIGLIQAFVFGMLTLVFMSQATQGHGTEEHHE